MISGSNKTQQGGFSFGMRGIGVDSAIDADVKKGPGVGQYEIEEGYKGLLRNPSFHRFQESKRFNQLPQNTPGPGSYSPEKIIDNQRSLRKKNGHSFSDASRVSGTLFDSSNSNVLGPGYYHTENNDSFHLPLTTKESKSTNLQGKKQTYAQKIRGVNFAKISERSSHSIVSKEKEMVPSVGVYTLDNPKQSAPLSFSKSKRQNSMHTLGSISPGPAKYEVEKSHQYLTNPQLMPITTMTTSKRTLDQDIVKQKSTPGPSTYEKDYIEAIKFKKESVFTFGKQLKESKFKWDCEPAPSQYQPFKESKSSAIKIGTALRPGIGNTVPGVGSYDVTSVFEKKGWKTSRDNSINSSSSQTLTDYKSRLIQKKQSIISSSPNLNIKGIDDFPLSFLQQLNSPSPASYESLLQVKQKEPKFPKSIRTEDFLDVFGVMTMSNRSPGPAIYSKDVFPFSKQANGVTVSKQKKKEIFEVSENPGVGKYNIDHSPFKKFASDRSLSSHEQKITFAYPVNSPTQTPKADTQIQLRSNPSLKNLEKDFQALSSKIESVPELEIELDKSVEK